MSNKNLLFISLLFLPLIVNAQSINSEKLFESMKMKLDSFECKRVSFDFEAKDEKDNVIGTQVGIFEAQGDKFKMTAPDLEVFCDGSSIWIFDVNESEVVIMPNDSSKTDIANNPFGILENIHDNSFPSKVSLSSYEGKSVYKVLLKPLKKIDATYASVEIAIDSQTYLPVYLKYKSINGQLLFARVINLTGIKAKPAEYYLFDPDLVEDALITDLR